MHIAAEKDPSDCARLLLDAEAPIEERDPMGFTDLIVASIHAHTETIELLLKAGANVDAQRNDDTSLIFAVYHGHREVIELLLAAEANLGARAADDQTVLSYILDWHPVYQRFPYSFCSGRETRKDIIKYLCERGADASAVDFWGYFVLGLLDYCQHIDEDERKAIKKILKRFGAK